MHDAHTLPGPCSCPGCGARTRGNTWVHGRLWPSLGEQDIPGKVTWALGRFLLKAGGNGVTKEAVGLGVGRR